MRYARHILAPAVIVAVVASTSCRKTHPIPDSAGNGVFAGRDGALVVIDCTTGSVRSLRPDAAAQRLAPCSTFKIWNALIGLEAGIINAADEAFYRWDGETRGIPAWNGNLTLREAFQASCVPAFQSLARRIGPERMQSWIGRIGYGDRDTSAGIDVFWLPAKGRKTILISPAQQADLMRRLVRGELPFSESSVAVLKELMAVKRTDKGSLYGKTGTSVDDTGKYIMGWFVGHVESDGRTYAFACTVKGENVMGKDARAIVETFMEKQGRL